jgi:hypothetical protein
MEITTTANYSFEKIYLDLVTLPESFNEFKYILTVQCELTKYVMTEQLKSKEANEVARKLCENVFLKYGIPKEIATDQGTEFLNNVMSEVCKLLHIKQLSSVAYHHESIGALERSHKVLGAYLRSYLNNHKLDWDLWLPYYTFAYNTKVHEATNYTPFELVFGRLCRLPLNLGPENQFVDPIYNIDEYYLELKNKLQITGLDAREFLQKAKESRARKANSKLAIRIFQPGEKILLKNEQRNKLEEVYSGPYHVVQDRNPNVLIKIKNKEILVHKDRIRNYYSLVNNFKIIYD